MGKYDIILALVRAAPNWLIRKILGMDMGKERILEYFGRTARLDARSSMLGEEAPEFTLPRLSGDEDISLSSLRGKPVALIFGAYTCPVFRGQASQFQEIYQRYSSQEIHFLFVYPYEAHPTDGFAVKLNTDQGVCKARPKTIGEKRELATLTQETFKLTMPMVVDSMDDKVDDLYGGSPVRLYLLDKDGIVVYQGPIGPFGISESTREWEKAIQKCLKLSEQTEKEDC